jgi:BirA family biotin operon repressor/biotin-[acetyl-CoA-carboxylase] ligase
VDDAPFPPFGHRTSFHAVTDSTNDEALALLRSGAPHGTVVAADAQRSGRGRRGRTWWSPPGNLYASFIVCPAAGPDSAQLALVAAVAAAEALGAGVPVRFKWPNDLLLSGRKFGGILIECEDAGAVIGMGINIGAAPADTPYAATSLAAEGHAAIAPRDLLSAVCRTLGAWYARWFCEGFEPVRRAWLERAAGMGQTMSVRLFDKQVSGIFVGIDPGGALLLDTDMGRRSVAAGEVSFGRF